MNFEYFIAQRLIKEKAFAKNISSPIVKIAIIAIALGIIMMLIAIATGVGLQRKIREKIALFNGHIEISNFDNNSSQVSIKPITTNQTFYPNFSEVPEVTHIQGVATKAGIVRTETDFEGVLVKGVGSDYKWDVFETYLEQGRLPNYNEKINEEVLISSYLANRLGYKLGDKVVTYFLKNDKARTNLRSFVVTGIYNSGYEEFDKAFVIADVRHIQRLNKWKKDEVGAFEVFVTDFDAVNRINAAVYKNIPSNLDSTSISQKYGNIFQWLNMFDFNIAGIIGIMILVAGINMITAILVLILERTQLIGMLKAMGSSNVSIRKIFMYNATYIILKGLFWGNLIGLVLIGIQYFFKVITLNPSDYYVKYAPVHITIQQVLALNIGTLVLCVLVLWIPSYVITKIAPIKAIKFQ
ncbi:ABC transporter permease [Aquimarina agarilytica]|uniref:ABC transporter permease n=1 Tax=Aquimarina agarilytica TaxID=1087449 RepID=UPI000289409D|nr:FtsX-like permease family protein [Aquimarina agarilytica]